MQNDPQRLSQLNNPLPSSGDMPMRPSPHMAFHVQPGRASGRPGSERGASGGGPVFGSPPPRNTNRRRKNGLILIALILLVLGVFAALGYYGYQAYQLKQVEEYVSAYDGVFGPHISVNDITISGLKPQDAFDRLNASLQNQLNSWSLNLGYRGHRYITFNYSLLGLSASPDELYRCLNEAWALTHSGDVHQRKAAIEKLGLEPYATYTTKADFNDNHLQTYLEMIAQNLNRDPINAEMIRFQPDNPKEPFLYQNDSPGYRVDIEKYKALILEKAAKGESGDLEIEPETINPTVTRAELEKNYALRATATTPVASSSTENRNNNIRLSCSKINGLVLEPGKSFSYNKIVGPRTYKTGFFEALEQVEGDLVTGVGGGVCQSSTTAYQAALLANLDITNRSHHSDPVGYAELGQDATVYYSNGRQIDFSFRNNTKGNIYISAHFDNAKNSSKRFVCTIRIYGPAFEDGVYYRLTSVVVETIPMPDLIIYKNDTQGQNVIFEDETKEISPGRDGQIVETYLEKMLGKDVIDRKLVSRDTYKPKNAVYWKGVTSR